MKQKYFYHEHLADYAELKAKGFMSRGELYGNPDDFNEFSSKSFLVEALPRLDIKPNAHVLELGCGTGPVACFLATLGYQVHGIDIIPDAIDKAKVIAAEQCLDIQYEVLDVCQLPREGNPYQLIIDSFCSQSMVTDPDRDAMFSGIKSRLAKNGYFLMSCCVFEPDREDVQTQIVDNTTGKVYTRFDQDALWDSDTETCYSPFQLDPFRPSVGPEDYEETICVDGVWYIHQRCYRTPENLRLELERHGFIVLEQNGEVSENAICVHQGACLAISYNQHQ
ncbi:MAG: class I SAM-dependent methyltransferase [Candidatus Poribacteria bacterium]|nr:class I SAM-dependent methyltransferase [Candidatus Poribacteria bacterium]